MSEAKARYSKFYVYNGIRGFVQGTIAKYGFYAFYPVHLFVIHCINSTYFS